jgi:hypothetical protein
MWQYTILREGDNGWYASATAGNPKRDLEEALNDLGGDGWELVSLEPGKVQKLGHAVAIQATRFILKRPQSERIGKVS